MAITRSGGGTSGEMPQPSLTPDLHQELVSEMSQELDVVDLSSSDSDTDGYASGGDTPSIAEKQLITPSDEILLAKVLETIDEGADLEELKMDGLKAYLRYYGLRLSGAKAILMERIQEHLDVKDGGGEAKYRRATFSINCTGDVVHGDVVLFEQKVYDQYDIVSRRATGPPLGKRRVAGRVVKESYGATKQQHTFTIEVLWSTGLRPLPSMHPLLIKGRNLYRLRTFRQPWLNEDKRRAALAEKHLRGAAARTTRAAVKAFFRDSRFKGNVTQQLKERGPKLKNSSHNHPYRKPPQILPEVPVAFQCSFLHCQNTAAKGCIQKCCSKCCVRSGQRCLRHRFGPARMG